VSHSCSWKGATTSSATKLNECDQSTRRVSALC
jgi:hypothetical protein